MTQARTSSGSLKWPTGDFNWNEKYLAKLPYMRGVRLPELYGKNELLDATIEFWPDGGYYDFKSEVKNAAGFMGTDWSLWSKSTATQLTNRRTLELAGEVEWLELLVQCSKVPGTATCGEQSLLASDWAVHVCVAQQGLLPTLAMAVRIIDALPENNLHRRPSGNPLAYPLNLNIAHCSESEHTKVIAYLDKAAGSDRKLKCFRMLCCPHHTEYAVEMIEDFPSTRLDNNTILQTALPTARDAYELALGAITYTTVPSVLLQIFLHGEDAYDLLWHAYNKASEFKSLAIELIDLIVQTRSKRGLLQMVDDFDKRAQKDALNIFSEEYPAAVLKCMMERVALNRSNVDEAWTKRLALEKPDDLDIAFGHVDEKTAKYFKSKFETLIVEESPANEIPALLSSPPWEQEKPATKISNFKLKPIEEPVTIAFEDKFLLEKLKKYQPKNPSILRDTRTIDDLFKFLQIDKQNASQLESGKTIDTKQSTAFQLRFNSGQLKDDFLSLEDNTCIAICNSAPGIFWLGDHTEFWHIMFTRHKDKALPGFIQYVKSNKKDGLIAALPVSSPQIAAIAIHAPKNAAAAAKKYMNTHPRTTLLAALPIALGRTGKARTTAQATIKSLAIEGHQKVVSAIASEYGSESEKALSAFLNVDPLLILPARIPALPSFYNPAALQRPILHSNNKALPDTAIKHIGTMLVMSKPDAPYAGIEEIKKLCTSDSLAGFAWDLFNTWLADGAVLKESWAFFAMGWFGDDSTANKLTPLIRQWPGESQHKRAVNGLDILALIGSDTSLMHLNAIANKVKFKGLREKAKEKIAVIAETRGLTAEQLGDRLVPDLDLDSRGRLTLDFGPREFQIAFDENLKTVIFNTDGKRLKSLPKPAKSDDAVLAKESTTRFSQLKKDARVAASIQLIRMEQAMSSQRRWPFSECREFYITHPLIQHLTTRVVWGVYDDNNKLINTFRVAEDQSLANSDDETIELTDDTTVGIVHPLELDSATAAFFGETFADYEILQPFVQLGRETFAFSDQEKDQTSLTKFANLKITTGSIMGLSNKGWERGEPQDGGGVIWYVKYVDDLVVELQLDPGIVIGLPGEFPVQSIPELVLHHRNTAKFGYWGNKDGQVNFAELDAISASELIRDLNQLVPAKD